MTIDLNYKECRNLIYALNARINKCILMRDEATCNMHEEYWNRQIKEARALRTKLGEMRF